MKKVLLVLGTSGIDLYTLEWHLKDLGITYETQKWNEITCQHGQYDLTVLFGLDQHWKNEGHLFASTVRTAIGPDAKLLIISEWGHELIAKERIREKYKAEYFVRYNPTFHLFDKVRSLLEEAKTAPCY